MGWYWRDYAVGKWYCFSIFTNSNTTKELELRVRYDGKVDNSACELKFIDK